jgi:hypothetical protein
MKNTKKNGGLLSRHLVRHTCLTIFRGSAATAAKKFKKIYNSLFFHIVTATGWAIHCWREQFCVTCSMKPVFAVLTKKISR